MNSAKIDGSKEDSNFNNKMKLSVYYELLNASRKALGFTVGPFGVLTERTIFKVSAMNLNKF